MISDSPGEKLHQGQSCSTRSQIGLTIATDARAHVHRMCTCLPTPTPHRAALCHTHIVIHVLCGVCLSLSVCVCVCGGGGGGAAFYRRSATHKNSQKCHLLWWAVGGLALVQSLDIWCNTTVSNSAVTNQRPVKDQSETCQW
jgi:hypothetical protein